MPAIPIQHVQLFTVRSAICLQWSIWSCGEALLSIYSCNRRDCWILRWIWTFFSPKKENCKLFLLHQIDSMIQMLSYFRTGLRSENPWTNCARDPSSCLLNCKWTWATSWNLLMQFRIWLHKKIDPSDTCFHIPNVPGRTGELPYFWLTHVQHETAKKIISTCSVFKTMALLDWGTRRSGYDGIRIPNNRFT